MTKGIPHWDMPRTNAPLPLPLPPAVREWKGPRVPRPARAPGGFMFKRRFLSGRHRRIGPLRSGAFFFFFCHFLRSGASMPRVSGDDALFLWYRGAVWLFPVPVGCVSGEVGRRQKSQRREADKGSYQW